MVQWVSRLFEGQNWCRQALRPHGQLGCLGVAAGLNESKFQLGNLRKQKSSKIPRLSVHFQAVFQCPGWFCVFLSVSILLSCWLERVQSFFFLLQACTIRVSSRPRVCLVDLGTLGISFQECPSGSIIWSAESQLSQGEKRLDYGPKADCNWNIHQ